MCWTISWPAVFAGLLSFTFGQSGYQLKHWEALSSNLQPSSGIRISPRNTFLFRVPECHTEACSLFPNSRWRSMWYCQKPDKKLHLICSSQTWYNTKFIVITASFHLENFIINRISCVFLDGCLHFATLFRQHVKFDASIQSNNTCRMLRFWWRITQQNGVIPCTMQSTIFIILTGDTSASWYLHRWDFCRRRLLSPDRRCWCCRPEPAPALQPPWCSQRGCCLCWCCCYCPEEVNYRL